MADDLKRFLAGEPIQARRITVFGRTWRWAKRNPAVASLVAAVLLVFTAGMLASGYYASVANREAATSARLANEARLREADALVQSSRGIRLSRRPGQRFDALDALKKAADIGHLLEQPSEWFIPLRNEAMNVLALPDVRITQEFGRWDSDTVNVDLSADFELYIQLYRSGVCVIRRVKDDSEVCRIPGLEYGKVRAHFGPGRWFGVVEGDSEHGRAERSTIWELIDGAPVRRYGRVRGKFVEFPSGWAAVGGGERGPFGGRRGHAIGVHRGDDPAV